MPAGAKDLRFLQGTGHMRAHQNKWHITGFRATKGCAAFKKRNRRLVAHEGFFC